MVSATEVPVIVWPPVAALASMVTECSAVPEKATAEKSAWVALGARSKVRLAVEAVAWKVLATVLAWSVTTSALPPRLTFEPLTPERSSSVAVSAETPEMSNVVPERQRDLGRMRDAARTRQGKRAGADAG